MRRLFSLLLEHPEYAAYVLAGMAILAALYYASARLLDPVMQARTNSPSSISSRMNRTGWMLTAAAPLGAFALLPVLLSNGKYVHLIGAIGLGAVVAFLARQTHFAWEHVVGAWGVTWLTIGCYLGLYWAPKERMMGDVGRILYVHVPAAWIAMLVFTIAFFCAVRFLDSSIMGWDWLVESCCEVGIVLNALLLTLGSIFAKPTWNTWWTWDPRLTASLVMMLTFIGVVLLRNAVREPGKRATWTGVSTIIAFLNIPITYMSVRWWSSMHQQQSTPKTIDPDMTFVMRLCAWAFLMIAIWFIARRWRIAKANAQAEMPDALPLPMVNP